MFDADSANFSGLEDLNSYESVYTKAFELPFGMVKNGLGPPRHGWGEKSRLDTFTA